MELKLCLREAKEAYRKKLEGKLIQNNVREVWDGMKTITGCKNRDSGAAEGGVERANELNTFFNRFDLGALFPSPLST